MDSVSRKCLVLALGWAIGCGLAATPVAATITLNLSQPLDGDTLVSPIEVRAAASTDVTGAQITSWQVFADGVTAYGTATGGGMATRLNLDKGSHELVVTVQDSTGDTATSTVNVVIGVCSGFTVSLDSPGGGSETSPVHFAASAASCHRLTGIAVYADDHEIFNQRGARSLDTNLKLQPGSHVIYARAWDSTGAYVTSAATPIDVAAPSARQQPQPAQPAKPPASTPPNSTPPPASSPPP